MQRARWQTVDIQQARSCMTCIGVNIRSDADIRLRFVIDQRLCQGGQVIEQL